METFKYDWLIVFVDLIKQEETVIINDSEQLKEYYEKNKNEIWIGFNNIHYDQFIFKGIILGMNPYEINNFIINEKRSGHEFSKEFYNIQMYNYDTMTTFNGLKTLEGFMGHNIKETTVPFNIDRPLTQTEIKEVVTYCKYDVNETIEVFMRRLNEFKAKMDLSKEFKLPLHNISKSNAQLAAEVLNCNLQVRRDEFKLDFPEELKLDKYNYIKRWYQNPVNHDYEKKLETEISGVPHIFAWGGIHGARDNYIKEGKFVLVDVGSYYPSLMIQYDYFSRNISDKSKFVDIYNERFRLKELKDSKQEVMKLILNTSYGCMGYKYNKLYDPRMRNNVCVTGQLFVVDLIEKMEQIKGISLIQSNTDGVLYRYETDTQLEQIKEVATEWSNRTRFNLGYDYFSKIIQKDVNNYIAVGDENVYVGGYVKDLNELNNDLPIINRCIREYFINGITPERIINGENRLIEYQKIVKVSSKYEYAIHNGKRLPEKTIRVFASNCVNDSELLKYRNVDGKIQTAKFANTSVHSFIDNGNIVNKHISRKLDKTWYTNLAWTRINQFKGKE